MGDDKYVNVLKLILRVIKGIIDNPNDEKKRSVKLGKSANDVTSFAWIPNMVLQTDSRKKFMEVKLF